MEVSQSHDTRLANARWHTPSQSTPPACTRIPILMVNKRASNLHQSHLSDPTTTVIFGSRTHHDGATRYSANAIPKAFKDDGDL